MRAKSILVVVVLVFGVTGVSRAEVTMDWVTVGDGGNVGELSGYSAGGFGPDRICGAVNYTYQISKYEVTNAQYCEFLNAVASTDTYSLYHTNMSGTYGGISQSGSSGSLEYSVKNGWENKPVNSVSWYNSIRFVNWMQNGQGVGDTETGAYTITDWDGNNGVVSSRNLDAQIWLPSEDEWYKAAYYKGGSTDSGYWDYATQSDTVPTTGQVNYFNVPGAPTDVGSYAFPSAYNTFDQNGNMWEWNEVLIEEPVGEMRRGKRGGSWSREASCLPASDRNYNYPGIQANDVGFRVASVPEPAIGGYIDSVDLIAFINRWLDTGCSAVSWCGGADINRDNYVDFVDFAWLAQYWEDAAPAPGRAGNPDPPYIGLPVVSIAADLSWTAGSDAAAHGVYFGTNPTPDANEFQGYQTSTTFDPGLMIGGTTYYWQVDEVGLGGEMAGEVWSFTTAPAPGQATNPIPADGESIDGYEYLLEPYSIYTILDFTAGEGAVSHEAFFSDDEAKVTARDPCVSLGAPPMPDTYPTTYYVGLPIPEYTPYTDSLVRGTWYYWCVDETDDQSQVWPGPVWSFYLRLDKALDPDPPDGQTFVSLTPTLSWGGGVGAEFHDVYFGYTFADVNDANMLEADPEFRDTQILHDTDWEPVADGGLFLDYETTYYWRIDEVRGRMLPIKPGTVVKGDIWSFTTHPFIHPTYPVGWWSFDEGEGSLAFDRSGHGNHGMLIDGIDNGLAWAPAEGALNFDGSNNLSRVMIPASAMTTTAGTIAIWANLTGPQIRDGGRNGSGYFFGCDNGGNDKILLYMDSSDTQLDMKVGNHGENNIVTLSTETWYHIALTWNGGVYAVYVNGLNLDTGSYGGLTSLPSTADIGNNGNSSTQSFHGLMGDVQLYDKSLSAAEIQQLHQDVAN